MTAEDVPAGLRLSMHNGWNQLEGDWQRQLDLDPDYCFKAQANDHLIGTACACRFGAVAWISLVLVDAAWRGRGIGTRLMRTVLDALNAAGVASVRLDATPLGQPIYEKLGFAVEYTLTRFAGALPASGKPAVAADIAVAADLPAIAALDREVTATDRGAFLRHLLSHDAPSLYVARGPAGLRGYAGCRPGARAWRVGPCLGQADACRALLAAVGQRLAGQPVFIDIPDSHAEAAQWAKASALTPQRTLTRMALGPPVREQLDRLWASFGPEKG